MINKKIYKMYKKIYIILIIPNNGIIWDLTIRCQNKSKFFRFCRAFTLKVPETSHNTCIRCPAAGPWPGDTCPTPPWWFAPPAWWRRRWCPPRYCWAPPTSGGGRWTGTRPTPSWPGGPGRRGWRPGPGWSPGCGSSPARCVGRRRPGSPPSTDKRGRSCHFLGSEHDVTQCVLKFNEALFKARRKHHIYVKNTKNNF